MELALSSGEEEMVKVRADSVRLPGRSACRDRSALCFDDGNILQKSQSSTLNPV